MFFQKHSTLLLGTFLLGISILIAYFPVNDATFIIDDEGFYIEDPIMSKPDGLKQIWLNPLETNGMWSYVPISRTTFWIERQIWGLNFSVTHWINVFFHFINSLLLWRLLHYLKIRGAWLIGMGFALHPIQVQSVAWIAERRNVVAGVFFILSLWGYFHFEKKQKMSWYFITLGLFLCALLSKSATIMLPPVFVICRFWLRSTWSRRDFLRLLPFFATAFAMGLIRIWFENRSFGAGNQELTLGFLEKLVLGGQIPFFYLSKIVVPNPLIFIYPKWNPDLSQFSVYLPLFSLLLLVSLLLRKYRQWSREISVGLGIYAVLIFPVMGFFHIAWHKFSFVSDHWAYLPSIPLLILLVQGFIVLFNQFNLIKNFPIRPSTVLWLILFIGMLFLTQSQVSIYKNEKSLWLATAADDPNSWEAHADLGKIFFDEQQFDLALKHADRSVSITQEHTTANVYNTRGNAYAGLLQYDLALQDYNRTLALKPNHSAAYNNRGNVHFELNQYDQALQDYNRALAVNPKIKIATEPYTNPDLIYYNRGRVLLKLKQYQAALDDFNQSLAINPDVPDAYYRRGEVFFILKKFQRALQDYTRTLDLNPNHVNAYFNRGTTFFRLGNFQKALDDFNKVIELHPENIDSYNVRGLIYIKQMEYAKALEDFAKAIALNPKNPASFQNRANLYLLMKQYTPALEDLNQAIQINPEQSNLYNQRGTLQMIVFKNQHSACKDWSQACTKGDCKNILKARQKGDCPGQ
ncbi:MAG: tetratricopeptide repeat protein [SAR324 cluster bacterium]|nr:tetratricopeptide repeat protein [SAR324 cluster bacterium]